MKKAYVVALRVDSSSVRLQTSGSHDAARHRTTLVHLKKNAEISVVSRNDDNSNLRLDLISTANFTIVTNSVLLVRGHDVAVVSTRRASTAGVEVRAFLVLGLVASEEKVNKKKNVKIRMENTCCKFHQQDRRCGRIPRHPNHHHHCSCQHQRSQWSLGRSSKRRGKQRHERCWYGQREQRRSRGPSSCHNTEEYVGYAWCSKSSFHWRCANPKQLKTKVVNQNWKVLSLFLTGKEQ